MKSTTIIAVLALGVTAAVAAPAPEAEARWCTWVGQSCWKVKRAAVAFAEAFAGAGVGGPAEASSAEARRSNAPGGAAYRAKRAVDDLAAVVASTRDDPTGYYNSLGFDVHFFPDEPEPEHEPESGHGHGAAANETTTKRAVSEAIEAREADARWCTWVGQSCWKVRRAAEAIVDTIDGFEAGGGGVGVNPNSPADTNIKRDHVAFEPVAFGRKRSASPEADPRWCTWVGQSCWKRNEVVGVAARCDAVGGRCASARRDLHAMYHAARSVLDELPAADKQ